MPMTEVRDGRAPHATRASASDRQAGLRIAQFIDTHAIGGAETLVFELCCTLQDSGHHPVLLHFGNPVLEHRCVARGIEVQRIPHHPLYKSARRLPLFIWQFSRFLRGLDLDAVHSHLLGAVGVTALAARLAGIRHVGTLHDTYSLRESPAYLHVLRLAAITGHVVAVSDEMSAFFRACGGFGSRLLTIHNGVRAPQARDRQAVRHDLAIAPDATVIICVARLVPLKAHARLLEAFAGVDDGSALLMLAGDGPLMEALQHQACGLGIADRVRFLGARSDVPDLLIASDVFVLGSDTEGMSCSLLEAMAAGLPAVATRVGGNPELVVHGETGLLVTPGDVCALRQAMSRLLGDAALRVRLGRQAERRARVQFSLSAMGERYVSLYRGPSSAARVRSR